MPRTNRSGLSSAEGLIDLASAICEEVKMKIGRELTSMEVDAVAQISRTVPSDPKLSRNLVARFYAKKIVEVIADKKKPATVDQMREYNMSVMTIQGDNEPLRQEIKADNTEDMREIKIEEFLNFGQLTGYQLTKQINPLSRMRYNYALLDTNACYERTDYVFKWLLNDQTKVSQAGILCMQGKLRNIKMARIGQATFANFLNAENALIQSQKRLAFDFEEFRPQGALILNRSAEFFMHFRDSSSYYDNNLIVSPFDHIRGWFRFDNSLRELSTLTLRIFDTISLTDMRVNSSNTLTISGIQTFGYAEATTTPAGNLSVNDPFSLDTSGIPLISSTRGLGSSSRQVDMTNVTFSGFTTDDPVADAAVIAAYNSTHSIMYEYKENANGRYFLSNLWLENHTNISTITSAIFEIPIQATFNVIAKPRVTLVIELISEDDSEDIDS